MQRRAFLGALLAVPAAALTSSCRKPLSRREVLGSLAREIIVPSTAALVPVNVALSAASSALSEAPSSQALHAAREAWRRAALAWKTASLFQDGPLVESKALIRATYWPSLPLAIEELLSGNSALDELAIGELSLSQKGIYALEYLLFPLGSDQALAAQSFSGKDKERRRRLARGLALDLTRHAQRAASLLGDGRAYAQRFEAGGQQSLSRLLAQLILGVENLAVRRIDLLLTLAEQRLLKPSDVEGWPSGSSHQLLKATLTGTARLYRGERGGGLADLVRAVAPAIAERAQASFQAALSAADALSAPLEQLSTSRPEVLRALLNANKSLERSLKVEVASALGVTLTFQTGDGD
jgi:predicted lipoprotein